MIHVIWPISCIISSTLTAIIFSHYRVAAKMALEKISKILGSRIACKIIGGSIQGINVRT